MRKLSSVFDHIHQYLKENKDIQNDIVIFKNKYGIDVFDSVEVLLGMCVNKDISRENLKPETLKYRKTLIESYQTFSDDYAITINKALDHMKKHYKNDQELVYNGTDKPYRVYDAIVEAEKVLGRTKTKEEGLTF